MKAKNRNRFHIISWLFILLLVGCRSNTPLDAWIYGSEWTFEEVPIQQQLCQNLEENGYKFDMFDVYQEKITVLYPDAPISYVAYTSVGGRAITFINRDFNSVQQISDEELARLQPEAQQLCEDMRLEAANLGLNSVGVGFVLYDWVNGVTINYSVSHDGDCKSIASGSIGLGGYGQEEQFEDSICLGL